ncbi:hypothetical protein FCIRC_8022 [Fusarium circinatum]|uniref:Uncharacterized protein n=1 Tax=Fusarium circinatum TaxID=48490 RepID=A0A8H5TQY2_FUSCI|nr:hypothetical protein FCIRC_8022 [Fusarium circinatum]
MNGQETGLGDDANSAEDDSAPATTTGPAAGEASHNATSAAAKDPGNVDNETVSANTGNTNLNRETTQGLSSDTGGLLAATSSGDMNQGQPTTDSQPADHPVSEKTSLLGSDNTSAVDTPSQGTQTTTNGDKTTSKDVGNNSDASAATVSPGNDQSTNIDTATTASPTATNDGSDSTPTTSKGGDDTPSTKAQTDDIPPITLNPETTANDAIPAPTITDAPEGLSPTTIGGHPEWVSNTWITTTGDNSETTIVPVLVGCPGCGGKGSGIVVFGFPKTTGTWFKLPGLPKFKFPCVPPFCTTSPDTSKDGDDDDDDDKSSSETCTDKATVTDCFVACTTYTGPAGSAITPECKTTCTKTHTGCDVVGTTTTSSATACGPSGDSSCKSCERKLVSEVDPEDLDEDTEESEENDLERRAPKKKKKKFVNVGGCGLLPKNPKFPDYPGGDTVLDNDDNIIPNNSPLKDIKKWWLTTTDENCSPELNGNLPAAEFRSRLNGGRPSIDHVYEKSMLLDYFKHIIDTSGADIKGATDNSPRNKISCSDIKAYGGADTNSNNNLLQKVFDAYPGAKKSQDNADPTAVESPQYLDDFIGMDQWTNANAEEVRAQCDKLVESENDITAETSKKDAETRIDKKLGRLEKIAIGIEMFSVDVAIQAMINQNQRIYARLIDIDDNAKGCMDDPAVKNGIWSFAKAYKIFMASRFDGTETWSINDAANYGKTKLIEKLTSDLAVASNVAAADDQQWQAKIGTWNARFQKMTDSNRIWAVPVPTWTWETVAKRDGDGLSCKRPIPTFTSSEEPTTFSTSVRSTSDDSNTEEPSSEESNSSTEAVTSSNQATTTSSTSKSGPSIGQRPGWLTDAPTLTDRISPTISTPDGYSCTKTVTETMCNLGTGRHGPACVTHSRCDSWVNTKTTSSKPSPSPTLASPKFSERILRCNKSGQASNPNAITYAAQSFCRDIVAKNKDNGYYWSNDRLEGKKVPSTGYHFQLDFSVRKNCLWKANYDECMKYMQVAIDGCNRRSKSDKLGGWVRDNCIEAIINPRRGA